MGEVLSDAVLPQICLPLPADVGATHNNFANSMALTPFAPSAGPTGGCGEAWPAGTSSLTTDATVTGPYFDIPGGAV